MSSILQPFDSISALDEYLGSILGSAESKKFGNVDYLIDKYSKYYSRTQEIFDPTTVDPPTFRMINQNQQSNPDVVFHSNHTQNALVHYPMATNEFHHQNTDSACMFMLSNSQQSNYMQSSINHYPTPTDQNYVYTTYNSGNSMVNYYQPSTNEYYPLTVNNTVALMTNNNSQFNQQMDSQMNDNEFDRLFDLDFGFSEVTPCHCAIQANPETSQSSIVLEKPHPASDISNAFDAHEWLIVSEIDGKTRRPLLHEFLRFLLDNPKYSHIAEYTDRKRGIFKFRLREEAAQLWQDVKARNSDHRMTYDKLARAIRFHYRTGAMRQTKGRFTFRFGNESGFGTKWWPVS